MHTGPRRHQRPITPYISSGRAPSHHGCNGVPCGALGSQRRSTTSTGGGHLKPMWSRGLRAWVRGAQSVLLGPLPGQSCFPLDRGRGALTPAGNHSSWHRASLLHPEKSQEQNIERVAAKCRWPRTIYTQFKILQNNAGHCLGKQTQGQRGLGPWGRHLGAAPTASVSSFSWAAGLRVVSR